MTSEQKYPTSTSVIAAGWVNPTNAYTFNNTYATCPTNNAEQEYDGYNLTLAGNVTLDAVYAQIKHYIAIVKAGAGDTATVTCTLRVYDGSSWNNVQITSLSYNNATPLTDEQPTVTVGDTSNPNEDINVTTYLNTVTKLSSAKFRLLFAVAAGAGVTVTWYVDCISLIAYYHVPAGIPVGAAKTKRDLETKEAKAIQTVTTFLEATA